MARLLVKQAGFKKANFNLIEFADGHLQTQIKTKVQGKNCLIITGTVLSKDVLFLLVLAYNLKKLGVKKIIALIPYLGYARQDKAEQGKSLGIAWFGNLLETNGVDQVITIDLHSKRAKELFPLPLESFSTIKLFSDVIFINSLEDATIVAPDEGALEKARALKKICNIKASVSYFKKKRLEKNIEISKLQGKVSKKIILVDAEYESRKNFRQGFLTG